MSAWSDSLGAPSGAHISECGRYRWVLWRALTLEDGPPPLVFVMLNPSTADALHDDPTIRRCLGFARREGAGGIVVVNLSAYRATDPKDLELAYQRGEAVHQDNEAMLTYAIRLGRVVLAWGAGVRKWMHRCAFVCHRDKWCLGRTKGGEPRHPLMVRGDTPLVPYP